MATPSKYEMASETGGEADRDESRMPMISVPGERGPVGGHGDTAEGTQEPVSSLYPDLGFVTGGGVAQTASDTIISVPEGEGFNPLQTEKAIISIPGEKGHHERVALRRDPVKNKPIEIVVYFMDKTGINLMVEDGQHAEAGELFEMVMDEMRFPLVARDVFSLWLVSDLLELQLKPNQVPFKLVCYWEELLEKYTTADEDDIERDEPVIMFQRNVFYPRDKEQQLDDPELLRLLYHEAKEAVVDARYPVEVEGVDELAGLQSLIVHRVYDEQIHKPVYFKERIGDFYPAYLSKKKWARPGSSVKEAPEYRLGANHIAAYKKYRSLRDDVARTAAHRAYLEFCWKLPYYGAAFFRGQIEHPGSKFRLRSLEDDPVYVAINTEGVFIIDMDDVVFLLGLLFKELSWEYAEPKNRDNPNCIPCLFLQFESPDSGEGVSKVMQIFSREAVLMDAMIETCIKLKKQQRAQQGGSDEVDAPAIIRSGGDTWKQFNRLCLATFDNKGEVISNETRQPRS